MKAIITKEQLQRGLQIVQNVANNRTTLPILSHVLLKAEGDRLHLTATDLDVTISTSVDAKVQQPGDVTLPAKRFSAIARELSEEELEIEVSKNAILDLVSGSSKFKIHGLNAEEFPPSRTLKEAAKIVLPQDKLKRLIALTEYAICQDESRYVLNGIYFLLDDGKLTAVSTDGRRLALVQEELNDVASVKGAFIVPTKSIAELQRLLGDTGTVEIAFTVNEASFTLTDESGVPIHLVTKLVEGNFPNYKQVIPASTKHKLSLPREQFLLSVRRAALLTSERSCSVKLHLSKNNLEVKADSPEVGEANEQLDIKFRGQVAIAFNPDFLMAPLAALQTDNVMLELNDELSPGLIRQISEDKTGPDFLYVLMPMRLGDVPAQPAQPTKTETTKPETKETEHENEPAEVAAA